MYMYFGRFKYICIIIQIGGSKNKGGGGGGGGRAVEKKDQKSHMSHKPKNKYM